MTQKTCKVCKTKFKPSMPMAKVCSWGCAIDLAVSERGKAEKKAQVKERRADKVKLQAMKSRGEWLKEAKTAVQRARRLEELAKGSGCMSCGRTQAQVVGTDPWRIGGYWDGGHFLSKGARPELALEPMNIWLQCKPCNAGSGKYAKKSATVNASFRMNLIDRIGLDAVELLEADHWQRHYDIDALKAIKATYAAKTRELKKQELKA